MSKDLLAYFEGVGVQVTKEDAASLYNMLIMPFFSETRHSCIRSVSREIGNLAGVKFLKEQIVEPSFFWDACSNLQDAAIEMVEKHQLDGSWVANALLTMIRALSSLNHDQLLKMGSRNKVFCSSYEIDGKAYFEVAVLEVRFRKSASLQNIWQKKPLFIDLSCYFYKGSSIIKPTD